MDKQRYERIVSPQSIFQPKTISIKASTLTNNQSQGFLSKIGSLLSGLWNKVANRVEKRIEIVPSKGNPKQVYECSLDSHMSVVLPILDPYKFQEEFSYKLTSSDNNKLSHTYDEEYIEDEGFYYIEDSPRTPTTKKSLYGDKKSKAILSEASWAETYGSESDTGASLSKEPVFPKNPPMPFAAPAIDILSKEDLFIKEAIVDQALEMIDDNKVQEPIMTLPFTTQADLKLLPILDTIQQDSAADFPIPTTMEMVRTESIPISFQVSPIKTTNNWNEVVYSKNNQ